MARTPPEWIGKTDDTKIPPRVCERVFDRAKGICHFCGQPIQKPHQAHETDHVKALINGGENRESNLAPIHKKPCHQVKTASDVKEKAKVSAVRKKHIGITRPAGKLQGQGFQKSPKSPRIDKSALPSLPAPSLYRSAS